MSALALRLWASAMKAATGANPAAVSPSLNVKECAGSALCSSFGAVAMLATLAADAAVLDSETPPKAISALAPETCGSGSMAGSVRRL